MKYYTTKLDDIYNNNFAEYIASKLRAVCNYL